MNKTLAIAFAGVAVFSVANCNTSTVKYKVASQEVVMHERVSVTMFGKPSTHIDDCMKEAGAAGATQIFHAGGRSCYGWWESCSSESASTSATQGCYAYGATDAGGAKSASNPATAPVANPVKPAKGKK
jgi:hypothetical protein